MNNFSTYFVYKIAHCGIWVWCLVKFLQWVYWLTKNLFLVNKSEFLGINRYWIENTYTTDMETWFLFTANKNALFNNSGTRLAQRAEMGLLDPVIFTVSLSSIQCNHVGCPFSNKLRNVALILYTMYLRQNLLIDISFFKLRTRMAPVLIMRPVSFFCATC